MRIGLNLLYLIPGVVGGTETYAAGLLKGLAKMASPKDEFVLFLNREAADWNFFSSPNFSRVVCPVAGTNRPWRYWFEQIHLPSLLKQYEIDLVHSLGYVGPISTSCPSVVTIHDLNYIDQAHTMNFMRRMFLRFFSTQAARKASHVIAVSQFSKKRLCQALHISDKKISVIYESQDGRSDHGVTEKWSQLRQLYQIELPYIVAFGGGATHKNIPVLLNAFQEVSKKFPHCLVLIGHMPPNVDIAFLEYRIQVKNRIITTGYIPDNHIYPLLNHAELFVFPSLYEGFGLPVLEAQQAGVAVACSTAGSLPEVAGDAALFFDPHSVESIAEAIRRCLSDDAMRKHLRDKGWENLKRFSWNKTATKTIEVYHDVLRY